MSMPASGCRPGTGSHLASTLAALVILISASLLASQRPVNAEEPSYDPAIWNATCRYAAYSVPLALFYNGTDDNGDPFFPLYVAPEEPGQYAYCFGPGEHYNDTLVVNDTKLACNYTLVSNATAVNYYEEQPCTTVDTNNCYCYALDRRAPGFCSPGIASRRRPFNDTELATCVDLVNAVASDGGRPVNRSTVYSRRPAGTHYIAAAVAPGLDFHFWRLDDPLRTPAGATTRPRWSYKAGGTFARNTYRTGAPIPDVEDPVARGMYTLFCGYFDVDRSKHRVGFVRDPSQVMAGGYRAWAARKVHVRITRLPRWSDGWYGRFRSLYVDQGWMDDLGARPRSPGSASPPSTPPPTPSPAPPHPSPEAPPPNRPPGDNPSPRSSPRPSPAIPSPPGGRPLTPPKYITKTITITPTHSTGNPATITIAPSHSTATPVNLTITIPSTPTSKAHHHHLPTTDRPSVILAVSGPQPVPARGSQAQPAPGSRHQAPGGSQPQPGSGSRDARHSLLPPRASRRSRGGRHARGPQLLSRTRCPTTPCRWELLP